MTHKRLIAVLLVLVAATAFAPAALATQDATTTERADLTISQPHYVDTSVNVDQGSNATTYEVKGSYFEIQPENFQPGDVIDYGVEQDSASLSYDKTTGEYILDTSNQAGTFSVYWIVTTSTGATTNTTEETSPGNETNTTDSTSGNESTTTSSPERVRYEAQIQTSTGGLAHIEQSKLNQLQEDAQNWSEVVSTFGNLGGDSVPIETKLETAANWYQFSVNPFSALSGDFTAAILMLVLTNGGRLALALLIGVPLLALAPVAIKYRSLKDRLPDVDELDQQQLEMYAQQRKEQAVEVTPHDLPMNGRTADKLQSILGENLWEIKDTIHRLFDHEQTKQAFLQAMAYNGATATITHDDDGVREVVVYDSDADPPDSAEALADLDDQDFDAVVEHADWSQVNQNALRHDVPVDEVDVPIAPTDDENDLVDELDVSIPEDFESREAFAEAIFEVWKFLAAHDYTDDHGQAREEQTLLNIFSLLSTVTAERYDHPDVRCYRNLFQYIASEVDGNEALRKAADEDGIGGPAFDVDLNENGGGSGAD
jgi:hypothetical protein